VQRLIELLREGEIGSPKAAAQDAAAVLCLILLMLAAYVAVA